MTIWIGEIPPDSNGDKLKVLLNRYGLQTFTASDGVPGDGSQPCVLLGFAAPAAGSVSVTPRASSGATGPCNELGSA